MAFQASSQKPSGLALKFTLFWKRAAQPASFFLRFRREGEDFLLPAQQERRRPLAALLHKAADGLRASAVQPFHGVDARAFAGAAVLQRRVGGGALRLPARQAQRAVQRRAEDLLRQGRGVRPERLRFRQAAAPSTAKLFPVKCASAARRTRMRSISTASAAICVSPCRKAAAAIRWTSAPSAATVIPTALSPAETKPATLPPKLFPAMWNCRQSHNKSIVQLDKFGPASVGADAGPALIFPYSRAYNGSSLQS